LQPGVLVSGGFPSAISPPLLLACILVDFYRMGFIQAARLCVGVIDSDPLFFLACRQSFFMNAASREDGGRRRRYLHWHACTR